MQIVQAKGIWFKFPESKKYLISSFSHDFHSGKLHYITGPSGAGKSTLIRCIYGDFDVDKGRLFFDGKRYFGPSQNLVPGHPEMAVLNQDSKMDNFRSLQDSLNYECRYLSASQAKRRINRVAKICEIKPLLGKLPTQISGGQKQRAALALTLVKQPKVLILDEPFSHLHFSLAMELHLFLKKLAKQEQICLIVVSHNPKEVLMFADEVIYFDKGKPQQVGTAESIYQNPLTKEIADYFGIMNPPFSDVTLFTRPESLGIFEGNNATVLGAFFQGFGYYLQLQSDDGKIIYVWHHRPISEQKRVRIALKSTSK